MGAVIVGRDRERDRDRVRPETTGYNAPVMIQGWQGEKVRLVPLDDDRHFDNAVTWLNDPEITRWTLVGDFPLAKLEERAFFERIMRREGNDLTFAVEKLDGEHIGFSGFHAIDWRHGFATTGTIIGRRELWGQGYGSDAARTRTRYAFDILGLETLRSEVMDGTTPR